jgi:hypothetical protein
MPGKTLQIVSKHDVGEHDVYVVEEDGKLHRLCTIPFEKGEVIPLLNLLQNLLGVVQSAAGGKKIEWADIAGRCKHDLALARQQPMAKKFEFGAPPPPPKQP